MSGVTLHYRPASEHVARYHAHLSPRHGQERRVAVFASGYGGGKTYGLCYEHVRQRLANPAHVPGMLVSPSYPMASKTIVPTLHELLSGAGIPYRIVWSGDHRRCEVAGRTIYIASAERPESLKGPNLSDIGLDEAGLIPVKTRDGQSVWSILSSRVRHPDAVAHRISAVGTPEGLTGLLYAIWEGEGITAPLARVVAPTMANPVLSDDFVRELEASFDGDDKMRRSFVLGEFVDFSKGSAYSAFRPGEHVADLAAWDPSIPALVMADNNISPAVALIAQKRAGVLCVHGEVWMDEAPADRLGSELSRRLREIGHAGEVEIHGDPALRDKATVGERSPEDALRDALREAGYEVRRKIEKAAPLVVNRVANVNRKLAGGLIRIAEGCKRLCRDLREVRWKYGRDRNEIDKVSDRDLTHASDALGYGVWTALGGLTVRRAPRILREGA